MSLAAVGDPFCLSRLYFIDQRLQPQTEKQLLLMRHQSDSAEAQKGDGKVQIETEIGTLSSVLWG